jgi:hypothetical protein
MATKAELEAELAALKDTHAKFRRKVVKVAQDYKGEHGWCNEVDAALRDMGLTDLLPNLKRKVTLVYEVDGSEYDFDSDSDYVDTITDQLWGEHFGLLDYKVEEIEPAAA